MGVVGVDSVVVEGWSSGFVVGLVLVGGQGGYFGELVLAPVGLPGDLHWVVRQFCFEVEPPVDEVSQVLFRLSRWENLEYAKKI